MGVDINWKIKKNKSMTRKFKENLEVILGVLSGQGRSWELMNVTGQDTEGRATSLDKKLQKDFLQLDTTARTQYSHA